MLAKKWQTVDNSNNAGDRSNTSDVQEIQKPSV